MHNRYQDDTRDDEISFDSNRNTPTTYFEVVTGGTEPTFEDFSHVPRGSANRVISPNDSFTTAEEDLTQKLLMMDRVFVCKNQCKKWVEQKFEPRIFWSYF